MKAIINDIPTSLPHVNMTVAQLVEWKGIRPQGTAIAVNDKIIGKALWPTTYINDLDRITVISAAFGG